MKVIRFLGLIGIGLLFAALGQSSAHQIGTSAIESAKNVAPDWFGYRKECSRWACTELGTTCTADPYCGTMDFPCMAKLRVSKCTQTCRRFDSHGNLIDSWEESKQQERHVGCCNICVMSTPAKANDGTLKELTTPSDFCFTQVISHSIPVTQLVSTVSPEPDFQLVSLQATNVTDRQDCDTVIHADCFYEPWRNTGLEWCGFSWACIFSLPPFSAHFIEQERTTTCRYRCANMTQYIEHYYQRRDLRVGCCGGGVTFRSRPAPDSREPFPR